MPDFAPPAVNHGSVFADMRAHHVAIRTPDLQQALDFYVGVLDFRIVATWPHGDSLLAYIAPPADDHFYVEILGGGAPVLVETRPYADLSDSLQYRGYHHLCFAVASVDATIERLRARAVTIVTDPFVVPAINRKLAFFCDPFGTLIELAEVLS